MTWLARVDRVSEHTNFLSALLVPLAWHDGEAWTSISGEDAERLFPERGQVFWYGRPANVERDALVVVRLELRHRHQQTGEKEAFQVAGARWDYAREVLDLRALGERAVRLALTGDGLAVSLSTSHVYVLVADAAAAGPLTLTRALGGKWRLPPGDHNQIEVRALEDGHASRVRLGDRDALVVHDLAALGRPIGMLNWASDDKLAAGVLKALRNLDRDAVKALGATDAVFRKYVEVFQDYVPATDLVRLQGTARTKRIAELVQVVADDQALLAEAARTLLAHPSVQDALSEPKRLAVEEALHAARAAVEDELEQTRSELEADLAHGRAALEALREHAAELARDNDALTVETEALQRRRDAAAAALADAQARLDDEVAAAAAALDERLAELAARPAALFAEASILRALTNMPAHQQSAPLVPVSAEIAGPIAVVPRLDGAAAGRTALAMRLMDLDLDPALAPFAIATFASGRPVVVGGDGGPDALRAFADVVAGGRLTWIPVSATLFDPAALLTQPRAAGGAALHPGGLLAAVEAARMHDGLALVVLEGFDRAATDHYLDPLLQCYRDAGRGRTARTLPYVGLDGAPARLAWPPNLLLACLPSAAAAVPPSRSFWADAVLMDAGDAVAADADAAELSDLSLADWNDRPEPVMGAASLAPDDAPPAARRAAEALYQHGRGAALSHDHARQLAFVGAVVPFLPDADAAAQATQATFPGAADLADRVRALVSALRPS